MEVLIEYLKQLKQAGIHRGVAVPGAMLDVRKMTEYITGKSQPDNPVPDNSYVHKAMQNHHNIYGFVCIDPHQSDSLQTLENSRKQGFSGLKLSPLSHQFTFSSKGVKELVNYVVTMDFLFIVMLYTALVRLLLSLFSLRSNFQRRILLLVTWDSDLQTKKQLDTAKSLPNFFLETSTGNFLNIQEAVKKAGSSKVIFGSEFPLSHPSIELQKIMMLDVSDRERTDILAGNIKHLLKLK